MTLIHPESCECAKSELDLFTVPFTQTSIDDSKWVEYLPLNSVTENSGPVEFMLSGSGQEYVDLSETYLHVVVRITNTDHGTDLTTADVGPANNFLHSMFNQVELSLNERLVTSASSTFAYKAYLETLFSFGNSAKTSHLTSQGYCGKMDYVTENTGFRNRQKYCAASKSFSVIGRPYLDLCFQERLILNGGRYELKFVRSKHDFCLITTVASLFSASLFARKVKLAPAVQLAHIKALEVNNAKYPIRRVETKVISVPKGNLTVTQENLFLCQLPQRIVVGCVDSAAFF